MKYLVFSDLHGSSIYSKKIIEEFKKNNCDYMICLGDILYHGPRNDLPEGYNPKEVIKDLNLYKDKIICIKGNCEAYVDQMVLDFNIHDELILNLFNKRFFLTHGHIINPINHLNISEGIVLYGHTHIYKSDLINNVLYLNPGSTTIPKGGCKNSYAILNEKGFFVYGFQGEELLKEYFK